MSALQRIFCCSTALLAKVYKSHILMQRCYFSCSWQLSMPHNRMTLLDPSKYSRANSDEYLKYITLNKDRGYKKLSIWKYQGKTTCTNFCLMNSLTALGNNVCRGPSWGWFHYQIAAAQWRMVHFGTPKVGPIKTPNVGSIDEGLISISAMGSYP